MATYTFGPDADAEKDLLDQVIAGEWVVEVEHENAPGVIVDYVITDRIDLESIAVAQWYEDGTWSNGSTWVPLIGIRKIHIV